MNPRALQIYHQLPPAAQSLAAGLWGRRLARLRYGPETDRLADEALDRDYWPRERLLAWRRQQLEAALRRAAESVPYYRRFWAGRPGAERLEAWPLLEKEHVRRNPKDFVADDCDPRHMHVEHTSGSTGTPLTLYRSRRTLRAHYALYEARRRRWHGLSRHNRWALVAGQLIIPAGRNRPPYWVWNAGLNQLYISANHISPDTTPSIVEALHSHQTSSILGYPSALDAMARTMLSDKLSPPRLKAVVCEAEPLHEPQRERIAQAFQAPVRETYGMVELVAGGGECEHGALHLWPEFGWVEVLDGDRPAAPGETGELVSTSLLDRDMPLIRYRTGDRGRLAPEGLLCDCGRALPLIEAIEGRVDDALLTRDGRLIGRMDPVFKSDLPIREAQIIQENLDQIHVVVVPAPGYAEAAEQLIANEIRARLGDVSVKFERVPKIPRGPNGKFKAVVNHMSKGSANRNPTDPTATPA